MDHWQVRRVAHPDAPELSELVGDINAFRTDTLFRHPLLSRVRDPTRFADVEVLWDDLLRRGTRQPGFRLVHAGATVSARAVTRRAGIGNRDLDDVVLPTR